MRIIGIIAAKENSIRFPGKNYYVYRNKPIFWHNWHLLNMCPWIDMTYIATNSQIIKSHFKDLPLAIIDRGINISEDEQSIFDVLKYAYYSLPEKADFVITILANTINHTIQAVNQVIELLISADLQEVRSYNEKGMENGIIAFRTEVFKKHEISAYMGMVISPGKEIHYKEELEDYK